MGRARTISALCALTTAHAAIDRQGVVQRHNIALDAVNQSNVLSVGNGAFAFNVDLTSLQSLNASYTMYDLNTLSDWAFHTIPFSAGDAAGGLDTYNYSEYTAASGMKVRYPTESKSPQAVWLHANPHRISLFQASLRWLGSSSSGSGSGTAALSPADITSASQVLDMWAGAVSSNLTLTPPGAAAAATATAGIGAAPVTVSVTTTVHPVLDQVSVRIALSSPTMALRLAFPYATGAFGPSPNEWSPAYDAAHTTAIVGNGTGKVAGQAWVKLARTLDSDRYNLACQWTSGGGPDPWVLTVAGPHALDIVPPASASPGTPLVLELSCLASPPNLSYPAGAWLPWMRAKTAMTSAVLGTMFGLPSVSDTLAAALQAWQGYWAEGAFVDLASNTADPSAHELERRVVLSQYLLRVHEAGAAPPQETGLLCNSWSGKHHMEMRLWHGGHWPLWGRSELLQRSDGWLVDYLGNGSATATFQGYSGVRWPKMVAAVNNRSAARGLPAGIDAPWLGLAYEPFPFNNGSTDGYGNLFAWESASGVGPLLVWQQPHTVWYAEVQRAVAAASGNATAEAEVLAFHAPLVWATADFLSSFPYWNATGAGEVSRSEGGASDASAISNTTAAAVSGAYWLGPPLYGAEESGDPSLIYNPSWEVTSFKWALGIAQQWRARLGLEPVQQWATVAEGLAPAPLDPLPPAGPDFPVYSFNQYCPGSYVKSSGGDSGGGSGTSSSDSGSAASSPCAPCTSHPSPAALHGLFNGPLAGINTTTANSTVAAILGCWDWGSPTDGANVWGWDFPLVALAQSRLGWDPAAVVSTLLLPVLKNAYTAPGLNYQRDNLPAYMPGNGGLLLAVAGMAAGFAGPDGSGKVGGGFPPAWGAQAEGFPMPLL